MTMPMVPSILKILTVFLGMLLIARIRVPLGLAIILGGMALDLWAGQTPANVWVHFRSALGQSYLWMLLAITALVVEFGRYMSQERNAQAIVALSRRLGGQHGRLWSLITAPSVLGLVPMPAGALFSAPMIQQIVDERHWAPEWKTAINYWFRHVWEYWWPIYPVVIISMSVFHIETWQYFLALMAFTPVTLITGYLFLLRSHRESLICQPPSPDEADRYRLVIVMLPLMIIILCVLLLPPLISRCIPALDPQLRKMLAMLIGMLLGIGIIGWDERAHRNRRLFASVLKPHSLNVLLTVGSVAIFQSLLAASDLLPAANHELLQSGFPAVLLVAGLPLLAGFITGVASGFAGMAFPLVVGLMSHEGLGLTPMATLALAFGFGYMGMMLSPIHLCLLVSRDYFSSSLIPIYRQILPCAVTMMGFSLILYGVFRAFGW